MECIKQFLPLENTVKIIEEGLASLKVHPICMYDCIETVGILENPH